MGGIPDGSFVAVGEGGVKCYLVDVPRDTTVLVRFSTWMLEIGATDGAPSKMQPPVSVAGGRGDAQAAAEAQEAARRAKEAQQRWAQQFKGAAGQREQDPAPAAHDSKDVAIQLHVEDPHSARAVETKYVNAGHFAFSTQVDGEHKVCLQVRSAGGSAWFGAARQIALEIDVESGAAATDYSRVAREENLSEMEVSIRMLRDYLQSIVSAQTLQRDRESAFRDISESANSRALLWSILQTALLFVVGVWQITFLRNFFVSKKVV